MTIETCKICKGRMIDNHCHYCGAHKVQGQCYNDRLIPMARGLRTAIPKDVTELFRTPGARLNAR